MKVLVLGNCEDASILADFLRERGIEVVRGGDRFTLRDVFESESTHIVVDEAARLRGTSDYSDSIERVKEKFPSVRVYGMSTLATEQIELPLHEDGHVYKPLGNKDLEVFYRALINDENKELVCIFLGLRFYASPERARILKARVTDVLLHAFSNENLVGIDVKAPPVDLTPTIAPASASKRREER